MLSRHEKQVNELCCLDFRQSRLMEQGCGWGFFESYFHACSHVYSADSKKKLSQSVEVIVPSPLLMIRAFLITAYSR